MRNFIKWILRHYLFILIGFVSLFLVYISSQTIQTYPTNNKYLVTSTTQQITTKTEQITTTTEVIEVINTTSTSIIKLKTTTTEVYSKPIGEKESSFDGPPHNITSLVGCIAFYESTWGEDPNVFQFTQGTWEAYGGVGSPSLASYSRQEVIFWLAWEDDGQHHWAAQKGRCF